LFFKSKYPKSIYLHGGVGRGKTMLMKMFYDGVSAQKFLKKSFISEATEFYANYA